MDKNAIRKFAVWARRELIEKVSQKALEYGIEQGIDLDANAESINGRLLNDIERKQRQALVERIKKDGYDAVIEEVAYTWFNRFIALRFMEVNGFLPSHVRVFTDDNNDFRPQILSEALHLEFACLDKEKVMQMKQDNNDDELYKYLIISQCNELSSILPQMFEKIADYSELLIPDYLLREGSVLEQMIRIIPQEDWKEQVLIIGWLYQYYIAEPKEELINAKKKYTKNQVPFVTQIFTSEWIVKYMVANSLGRLWIERSNYDETANNEYFLNANKPKKEVGEIDLENLRILDPCMGSGHILVYAFDELLNMYEKAGYDTRDAVEMIITKNMYGLDIDERAVQLAYFSIMMKGRQYDRRIFSKKICPNLYVINGSDEITEMEINHFSKNDNELEKDIRKVLQALKGAHVYGSLIHCEKLDFTKINNRICELENDNNLLDQMTVQSFGNIFDVYRILQEKYDAVITNPPYLNAGYMPDELKDYIQNHYPDEKTDTFASFMIRVMDFTKENGHIGMLTPYVWMFISSYEKLRTKLLKSVNITSLVQLEYNAFEGATVPVCAFTLKKSRNEFLGDYVRLADFKGVDNQEPRFLSAVADSSCNYRYQVDQRRFEEIPTSVIGYWASEMVFYAYKNGQLLSDVADIKQGLKTGDNNRFLRMWHEVSKDKFSIFNGHKWYPCNKGGDYRRWYGNNNYVINWENDGYELKNFKDDKGKLKSRPQNLQYMFMEGLTYTNISSSKFGIRYCPEGFAFDAAGSMIFPKNANLYSMLGLLSSDVISEFTTILSPTMSFEVGQISAIPYIDFSNEDLITLVKRNIELAKDDWDCFETSWDFKKHPMIQKTERMEEAFQLWEKECKERFDEVKKNERIINQIIGKIYGDSNYEKDINDEDITITIPSSSDAVISFISYAVGCMFGRYSLSSEGLQMASPDSDYVVDELFPADRDNIIPVSDDDYFDDDIANRFIEFVRVVYGERYLEENLAFIADAIRGKEKGTARQVIRNYFLNSFFADHCEMYAITGSGKRPIYWLFDSGKKNGFKCLIYMHRYQADTLARIRTDYVHEQQARYKTAIEELEIRSATASDSEKVKLSKKISSLKLQDDELHLYEEKIHHLADQMIKLDLDDGVKENYAKFKDVLAKI